MNILHDFFNSRSDASTMEASEQEKLEKDFANWFDENMKSFEFASNFLIKHMAENCHPHMKAVVESDRAELLEGRETNVNNNFILD